MSGFCAANFGLCCFVIDDLEIITWFRWAWESCLPGGGISGVGGERGGGGGGSVSGVDGERDGEGGGGREFILRLKCFGEQLLS